MTPYPLVDGTQPLVDAARYCFANDSADEPGKAKIFTYCEGSYLFDETETPFLDLQMWHSTVNFGYANQRLNKTLKRQLTHLPQISGEFLYPEKINLAARIAQYMEKRFTSTGRVAFSIGFPQGIEDSLTLAAHYANTARTSNHDKNESSNTVFAFTDCHQNRLTSLDKPYAIRSMSFPYAFRRPKKMGADEYGEHCLDELARQLKKEQESTAKSKKKKTSNPIAFYIEAVQSNSHLILPASFFFGLKDLLDHYNILLIADESQSGFYRTGKLWSIEHFAVKPDMLIFGGAMTNGLNTLGGLWMRENLASLFSRSADREISSPASAVNPLGAVLGLEVMNMVQEVDYETMVTIKGKQFLAGLMDLQKRHPEIGEVDGLGLALRIEICEEDGFTPNPSLLENMVRIGLSGELSFNDKKIGLILRVGGEYRNIIVLSPSLLISNAEMALAVALLDQLLTLAKG